MSPVEIDGVVGVKLECNGFNVPSFTVIDRPRCVTSKLQALLAPASMIRVLTCRLGLKQGVELKVFEPNVKNVVTRLSKKWKLDS